MNFLYMLRNGALAVAYWLLLLPLLTVQLAFARRRKDLLVWGPVPIANNRYWSAAMAKAGWKSTTLVSGYYASINRREDFDLYFEDLVPWPRQGNLNRLLRPLFAHLYIARHAAVAHIPFSGGPLGHTALWRVEAFLFRLAGVKTVLVPYGADIYRYSRIPDASVRHALLLSYPAAGRSEGAIERRVRYWVKNADAVVMGFTLEGVGRWDVPSGNMVCVDTESWKGRTEYSEHDGASGPVRIVHSPNHRGAKGTEFLVRSVEELRREGLQVELVLLEGVPNEQVRQELRRADIAADQFVLPGYGLAAVEAMASGLPVMANLEAESCGTLFRRYSYLDECPILSATPESLTEQLRALVKYPSLRRQLGTAGRTYAEKYHSYAASQYLFGAIHTRIVGGKDVDLMNLFHPLKSPYNSARPTVVHPLVANHLPQGHPFRC
jgi:glycosyltransferase involved in cell wall biosynthesis